MVHGGRCQQSRDRNAVLALPAVGQDQDIGILQHRLGRGPAHFLERIGKPLRSADSIPRDIHRGSSEGTVERVFNRTNLGQVLVGKDGLGDFQTLVCARIAAEKVRARTDHRQKAHHQFLADRIDRRIGHLGKILLEIIVEQPAPLAQHRDRCVGAH